jgi:hypothetical protein
MKDRMPDKAALAVRPKSMTAVFSKHNNCACTNSTGKAIGPRWVKTMLCCTKGSFFDKKSPKVLDSHTDKNLICAFNPFEDWVCDLGQAPQKLKVSALGFCFLGWGLIIFYCSLL